MTRTEAILRISDGLGFRTGLDAIIIRRLKEAQRLLEKGKTLPRFLLQEDQLLSLPLGGHALALPTGYIRTDDDNRPHYTPKDTIQPYYLERKYYSDAVMAQFREQNTPGPLKVYVIRKSTIDFIVNADRAYSLRWNYYKAGVVLDSDNENEWLANAAEWLIGVAGGLLASDMRNPTAKTLFDELAAAGRSAVFSDDIARELADGPLEMGANS